MSKATTYKVCSSPFTFLAPFIDLLLQRKTCEGREEKEDVKKQKITDDREEEEEIEEKKEKLLQPEEPGVWRIAPKRKIRVCRFKGKEYVHVRDYYDKDGEERPGKGIGLNVDQWKVLCSLIPDINKAIEDL